MTLPFFHIVDSAIIENDVTIGLGTKIWHFAHISTGVVIGKDCIIGDGVFVGKNVRIGDNCKIQNNVFIPSGVTIESNVFIGPHVVFTNVKNPRAFIERKHEFKPTVVCEGATIGANSTVICGVTIYPYALVGAGSVVTKDVYGLRLVICNPARDVGGVDEDANLITWKSKRDTEEE